MVAALPRPEPPENLWAGIAAGVASEAGGRRAGWHGAWPRLGPLLAPVAVTAVALALVGVYFLVGTGAPVADRLGSTALAFDLGPYLDAVAGRSPRRLAAFEQRYDARATSLAEAAARAGFEPVAPPALPEGWHMEGVRLLKDGCCHAVQLLYTRERDRLALFQQPADHPLACSRGGLREGRADGFRYHRAHEDGARLVTWTTDSHRFALVGARPEAELVATARWLTTVAARQAGAERHR